YTHLKIGDPVGVKWLANSCEDCRKGHKSICVDADLHGLTVDGSFQQWCLSFANHALKEIGRQCGDFVVIPGAGGGLSHLACQYARAMDNRVIAIDSGDEKCKHVASYGIKDFIDFKEDNVQEKVFEATEGRSAHATVVRLKLF
ncbi:Alcohol dehydrogenase, partial [Phytophthora palmivora]